MPSSSLLELRPINHSNLNIERFLWKIGVARQTKSGSTFIAPRLGSIRQIRRRMFHREPKKIILLGDGRSNFYAWRSLLYPASIVWPWLRKSDAHAVCAIDVHLSDVMEWEKIVGRKDNVFKVGEWLELLMVLGDVVIDIYGWKDLEFSILN